MVADGADGTDGTDGTILLRIDVIGVKTREQKKESHFARAAARVTNYLITVVCM